MFPKQETGMASITDRGKGRPKRWQVKYRTPTGAQRSESFATVKEANTFAAKVTVKLSDGGFVDPRAGNVTFGAFCGQVQSSLEAPLRPKSRLSLESCLRARVLPWW